MALEHLLQTRLIEVGKCKIGALGEPKQSRSGGTYRQPVKLDHWLITTLQRDETGQLAIDSDVMASLKDYADKDGKIRRLPIFLLSNNLDEVMTCNYVAYAGKTLIAKSDGQTLTTYLDRPGGAYLQTPHESEHTDEAVKLWKMRLFTTLNVMIASPSSRFGGVYKFRTTSQITANQLYGSLVMLRKGLGGILKGVPLQLVVRPMQVSPEGKATTVYVVHVELNGTDLQALRAAAMDQLRFELANVKEVRALEAQYRELVAHVDEPDAEEFASLAPHTAEPTADAEYATVPPTAPPVDNETGQPAEPTADEYAGNVAAFLSLLHRKGFDLASTIKAINGRFKTKYANNQAWDTIELEHKRFAAAKLMEKPDAPPQEGA